MMCGLLFLISEITFGASRHLLLSQQAVHSVNDIADADDDDDDDEKYDDIPEDDENEHIMSENINNEKLPSNDNIPVKNCENTASSWIHRANLDRPHKSVTDNHSKSIDYNQYDPYARNPLYAGADKACIWELIPLSTHFHPSVALFASNILSGQRISYSGDPLQDFTLSRFLNRFVYRNPKKVSSDSEVPRQRTVLGKRKYYTPVGATAFAINSTSYCSQPQSRIPIEEQFFHKYFVDQKQFQDERDKRVDEDLESIQSDEVDEFLNRFDRGSRVDEYDLDYANEFKSQTKASKGIFGLCVLIEVFFLAFVHIVSIAQLTLL